MCGRTAQTVGAVHAASTSLSTSPNFRGSVVDNIGPREENGKDGSTNNDNAEQEQDRDDNEEPNDNSNDDTTTSYRWHDNYNLSPGHDAVVFTINKRTGESEMNRKIWGLVTRGGTTKSPLPPGSSKHFANLMFNARSDTLFSKPTFAKLLNEGKTCLVALDGFFEWKADPLGGGKGKKQPYFVFRNTSDGKQQQLKLEKDDPATTNRRPYLLMAGLWTSVPTGYSPPQPTTLDTFTILTTEVCDPLKWLHSRMPVCVWDEDLAMQWLQQPTQKLHQQLDHGANKTSETLLQWHAVSTQMSSVRYRSADAIKAIPKPKSVKAFFAPIGGSTSTKSQGGKDSNKKEMATKGKSNEPKPSSSSSSPISGGGGTSNKRPRAASVPKQQSPHASKTKKQKTNPTVPPKKGSIASFFSPKKKSKT